MKTKTKANPVLAHYARKERRKSSVRQGSYGRLVTVGKSTRKERAKQKVRFFLSKAKDPESRKKLRSLLNDLKSM